MKDRAARVTLESEHPALREGRRLPTKGAVSKGQHEPTLDHGRARRLSQLAVPDRLPLEGSKDENASRIAFEQPDFRGCPAQRRVREQHRDDRHDRRQRHDGLSRVDRFVANLRQVSAAIAAVPRPSTSMVRCVVAQSCALQSRARSLKRPWAA
jgi:hypothetical protein